MVHTITTCLLNKSKRGLRKSDKNFFANPSNKVEKQGSEKNAFKVSLILFRGKTFKFYDIPLISDSWATRDLFFLHKYNFVYLFCFRTAIRISLVEMNARCSERSMRSSSLDHTSPLYVRITDRFIYITYRAAIRNTLTAFMTLKVLTVGPIQI